MKDLRPGVSIIIVVLAFVIVVAVGGTAFYFFALGGQGSGTSTSTTHSLQTSQSVSTTGGQFGYKTYSGNYHYAVPVGPSGDRLASNNSVEEYKSFQDASGTFTFFINPANYSGNGVGHGTFTITTTGFCAGSTTFQYSFKIYATTVLHGNITLAFETPTPTMYMVPLSCTGPMNGVDTSTNNPGLYLSVYPNLVSVVSVPVNVNQVLSGGISYQYSIIATN